jgi:hypothetical protein
MTRSRDSAIPNFYFYFSFFRQNFFSLLGLAPFYDINDRRGVEFDRIIFQVVERRAHGPLLLSLLSQIFFGFSSLITITITITARHSLLIGASLLREALAMRLHL